MRRSDNHQDSAGRRRHGEPRGRAAAPATPWRHTWLAAGLAGALAAGAGTAGAQQAASPAGTPTAASPSDYRVGAGTLDQALNQYAAQAGILLVIDANLTAGRTSPGLTGRYGVEEGLARLLADAGLEAVRQSGGSYALRRAATVGSRRDVSLPAVTVMASREAALGPVQGYRATRSAAASKMDVAVAEIPQTVSTIGAEQMRDQAAASVNEAVRYTAGVRPLDYGITDDDLAVRGIFLTGTGLYRDGMRLIQNGFMTNLEPYGLERLEVVHGPASVIYGQAAPGGIVNAVTKRPRAGQRNEVGVEFGSHQRRQATADVGGALNEQGTLLGRLTVLQRKAGTEWDGLRSDRTFVAPALTFQGERTSLTLLAQYQKDETGFAIPYWRETPFGEADDSINVNGPGSFHRKRSTTVGYLFEHEFSDAFRVRQNLRYLDGENLRHEMRNRGLRPDLRSMNRLAMVRPDSEQTWVLDNQAEWRLSSGRLEQQIVVGMDYYRSRLDLRIHSLNGAVAPLDIVDPVYLAPAWGDNFLADRTLAKVSQVGLYVQDQIKFDRRWVLSLGGRYDWARTDSAYEARATADAAFSSTPVRRRDEAFTGRAGLVYLADNGWAPYASFSTSFQPPLSTATATDAEGRPFEPETGRQLEAGVRYAPAHAGYTLSAAVFDLSKRNVQTPSREDPRFNVQTGEIRSRGLELQGSGDLGGGFSAIASYAYLDAVTRRSNTALEVGSQRPSAPRHAASAWGKYRQGDWEWGLGVRYISSAPGDVPMAGVETPRNDGYTLFDALVAYDTGPWRLALNVSNLFDKRYRTQCNVMRGGADFCVIGYERDVRLAATYRF